MTVADPGTRPKVIASAYSLAYYRNKIIGNEFDKSVVAHVGRRSNYDDKNSIKRLKLFDALVEEFILTKPKARILNLGCGYCSRWERLPKELFWLQVDFPEIIEVWEQLTLPPMDLISQNLNDGTFNVNVHSFDLVVAEGSLCYVKLEVVLKLFKTISTPIIFDGDSNGILGGHYKKWNIVDIEPYLNQQHTPYTKISYKNSGAVFCLNQEIKGL